MNLKALRKRYGDEYPTIVVLDGIRMPLVRETRFSRHYQSERPKVGTVISRFMDGSASITAAELERDWPGWSRDERVDFCQSANWLRDQDDLPAMLRFIAQNATPEEWSGIANGVATMLPPDEAFPLLLRGLKESGIGRSSNFAQAISLMKHPQAEQTLRRHFKVVWSSKDLWKDDSFLNWTAFDATMCILHLIQTGAPPGDFEDHVRQLSQHVCQRNQTACRNHLAKHFRWLG